MTNITFLTTALAFSATTALAGESVTYEVDGNTFDRYLAQAETPRGTIVILPTWNGLSDYERGRARMLAELGFTSFAADLYPAGEHPTTMKAKQAALQAHLADQVGS